MKNIQEREAKEKFCPFINDNCKGRKCLSWVETNEKIEYLDALEIKAEKRLSTDEKKIFEDIKKMIFNIISHQFKWKSADEIPFPEILNYIARESKCFKEVIEKLKTDLTNEELESRTGFCILLKDKNV